MNSGGVMKFQDIEIAFEFVSFGENSEFWDTYLIISSSNFAL